MIKLSRTKIELSIECPRCFWLNMRHNVTRPSGPPFTLNLAIDFLFKKEFDAHRENGTAHWIIKQNKIDAVPYNCPEINTWRYNFTGVQVEHAATDFLVYGAVDDIWINKANELIVVDYKATGAKEHKIYDSYKRQMEIYQWLLKNRGLKVSNTGYFLFARANKETQFSNNENMKGALAFDIFLEPLQGDSSWVDAAIVNARKIYDGDMPIQSEECAYCAYVGRRTEFK